MTSELPVWVQYVQALAPTVVSVIAAVIAWSIQRGMLRAADSQVKNAQYKLRLDLFDRRYLVYESLMKLLAPVEHETKQHVYLIDEVSKAKFLFSSDACDFANKAIKLEAQKSFHFAHNNVGELQEAMAEMFSMSQEANGIFGKYLSLENIK